MPRGLPPGLTINPSTGVISGTPRQRGSFPFTVQARSADGAVATSNQTIDIVESEWINALSLVGVTVSLIGLEPPTQGSTSFTQHSSGLIPQGSPNGRTGVPSGIEVSYARITLPAGYTYSGKTRVRIIAHNLDSFFYQSYVDLVAVGDFGAAPPAALPYVETQTGLTLTAGSFLYTGVYVDGSGQGQGTAEWQLEVEVNTP